MIVINNILSCKDRKLVFFYFNRSIYKYISPWKLDNNVVKIKKNEQQNVYSNHFQNMVNNYWSQLDWFTFILLLELDDCTLLGTWSSCQSTLCDSLFPSYHHSKTHLDATIERQLNFIRLYLRLIFSMVSSDCFGSGSTAFQIRERKRSIASARFKCWNRVFSDWITRYPSLVSLFRFCEQNE